MATLLELELGPDERVELGGEPSDDQPVLGYGTLWRMPWAPELFSAPLLSQAEAEWGHELVTVPFFDGLLSGEVDALVGSFVDEPELHHPTRGRIRGTRAFEEYVAEESAWLRGRNVAVENVEYVVTEHHGLVEVVLHVDVESGRTGLPVAVVNQRAPGNRIAELRMYSSSWPLTGRHEHRPPLLQPDPRLRTRDVVGEYQRALADGDVERIVATFEAEGYAREPAGDDYVHQGPDALRAFYELCFSNGGGIALEHCTLIDDGRACALEYNVVRWGQTEVPPEAGIAVYVRGESGRLSAARIYDDVDPPLGSAREGATE